MKFVSMVTCMIWVFGVAPSLLAQFVPVVAKQRVVHLLKQSDGSEVAIAQAEGHYYRSSSGDVMDTTKYTEGLNGKHTSIYMEASTRRTYSLDHNGRKATLLQIRTEPFKPTGSDPRDVDLEKDTIEGLRCYILPMTSADNTETGKLWLASESELVVKSEEIHGRERVVREIYDIEFVEPESSKFGFPSTYTVDESVWNNMRRFQLGGPPSKP